MCMILEVMKAERRRHRRRRRINTSTNRKLRAGSEEIWFVRQKVHPIVFQVEWTYQRFSMGSFQHEREINPTRFENVLSGESCYMTLTWIILEHLDDHQPGTRNTLKSELESYYSWHVDGNLHLRTLSCSAPLHFLTWTKIKEFVFLWLKRLRLISLPAHF